MKSRPIFCPNCSARVAAGNINMAELLGKCEQCDHVFRLNPGDFTQSHAPTEPMPPEPSGVLVDRGFEQELLIIRRWFEPAFYALLLFCIAWDGFLIYWYSMMIFGEGTGDGVDWVAILFPICHVAAGVALTYYVLAGLLNESTLFMDWEVLSVRHRPIPWYGNRDLLVEEIQGVEIDYVQSNNDQPRYSVSAHLEDGQQVVLLSSMKFPQAKYIAWHIANDLAVPLSEDKPIRREG